MESHTRIQCSANIIAIQQLECSTFKVLIYLACRSNQYGTCFPYQKTIEKDTGISDKTVHNALEELVTHGYIKFLRHAYHNRFTNESRPPLFQVSPHFLEIAEEYQPDALELWSENGTRNFSDSNQQQESALETNDITQLQKTTTTTNNDSDSKPQTANREKQKTKQREQTNSAPQPKSESSAIVKNYTNPILITQPLQDLNEQLAESLSGIDIKIVMARGFIAQYGYDLCHLALKHLTYLQTKQIIENPAGFYRYLLQSNMANVLPSMRENRQNSSPKEYDEFMES